MAARIKRVPGTARSLRGFIAAECISKREIARRYPCSASWISTLLLERRRSVSGLRRVRAAIAAIVQERLEAGRYGDGKG